MPPLQREQLCNCWPFTGARSQPARIKTATAGRVDSSVIRWPGRPRFENRSRQVLPSDSKFFFPFQQAVCPGRAVAFSKPPHRSDSVTGKAGRAGRDGDSRFKIAEQRPVVPGRHKLRPPLQTCLTRRRTSGILTPGLRAVIFEGCPLLEKFEG